MGLDRIVSNQPQYNMIWRVIESEVIPLAEQEGIGQIVWSPIAQGVLTGKYLPGAAPPAGSRATDERGSGFVSRYLTDEILSRVQLLKPVAEQAGLTLAQLAVAWTLQNPAVSAAIIGATRPEQVSRERQGLRRPPRPRGAQADRRHPGRPDRHRSCVHHEPELAVLSGTSASAPAVGG